ncbi:MAG: hypothetical protein IFJ97_04140, partial [Acidobacteria bacterium]|nr:hypothetical protein [Candidatus Sulfomarinibacter kjeldsenii]
YRPFILTMLRHQRYPEVRNATDAGILEPYDVASWSLPLSMGVEIVEASEPLKTALEPLAEANWPQPEVDENAAGHLIPASSDSAYPTINRLLAKGVDVRRLAGDSAIGSRGDIYLSAAAVDTSTLAEIADELHVPVAPVADTPSAEMLQVESARVGLFKPWVASMDEGWTRFVLEQYEFPLATISNEQIRSGEFTDEVDVLLFPSVSPSIISNGEPAKGSRYRRRWTPMPPKYSGGIDTLPKTDDTAKKKKDEVKQVKGGERIKKWVEAGGTVVALDSSSQYFIDLFELPVNNVLAKVDGDNFNCPGSMLRVEMNMESPLTFGMQAQEAVYFADSPTFQTRVPDPRFERTVIARYPNDDKDILLSGYLEGGKLLEKRAAVVEIEVGKGRVILIGFRAQHRAQPVRTFKLLFNTLYTMEAPG